MRTQSWTLNETGGCPRTRLCDPLQVLPKLGAMRLFGLERFQRVAGVFVAFAVKVDSSFCGIYEHLAGLAVGASRLRTAAVAAHLLLRKPERLRQGRQPRRVLIRGDVQRTGLAVKAAYGGEHADIRVIHRVVDQDDVVQHGDIGVDSDDVDIPEAAFVQAFHQFHAAVGRFLDNLHAGVRHVVFGNAVGEPAFRVLPAVQCVRGAFASSSSPDRRVCPG